MTKSRLASLAEAVANVAVGYLLAVLVQLLVFPAFGLQPTLVQNLAIGLIFTGVVARSELCIAAALRPDVAAAGRKGRRR